MYHNFIGINISKNYFIVAVRGNKKVFKYITKATATSLLAIMPELGNLNRKQVASLAGVAPYPYESGKKIGYRKTYGGRADLKPVLFISAMTASRSNS